MKKIILLSLAAALTSCSSDDRGDDLSVSPSLSGAQLSPEVYNGVGYNTTTTYQITKGSKIFTNHEFTWKAADTTIATVNIVGQLFTKNIGTTTITASDAYGNTLTSVVNVAPKVTELPEIPFIKWGATASEVVNNVTSDWNSQINNGYVYLQKNNTGVKYYFSSAEGLWKVEYMPTHANFSTTYTNLDRLSDFVKERYIWMWNSDPNYNGIQRWYRYNSFNQKVIVGIHGISGNQYYLRFTRS